MRRSDARDENRLAAVIAQAQSGEKKPLPTRLPRGWRAAAAANGTVTITHPLRRSQIVAIVFALFLEAATWFCIVPGAVAAFTHDKLVAGIASASLILVLALCGGAVLHVAMSLRERWRLARNSLEVRHPTLDGRCVESYVGAKFIIVKCPIEEGGGWALRVMTLVTVAELCRASSLKVPLMVGEFLSQATGCSLQRPDDLGRPFSYRKTGRAQGATREGPPPGLGFTAESEDDGSLRIARHPPAVLSGRILLSLGGILVTLGFLSLVSDALHPGGPGVTGMAIFLILGLGMALAGFRPAFEREEWHVGLDLLEVQEIRFGAGRCAYYSGGTLTLVHLTAGESMEWHLVVLARDRQGFLLSDITPEGPKAMGEFLSDCTGWSLKLPDELEKSNVTAPRQEAPPGRSPDRVSQWPTSLAGW